VWEHKKAWVNCSSEEGWCCEALCLNRTQGLVLSFFALAWASLVAILVAVPEIYDQALQLTPGSNKRLFDFAFLAAVSVFIAILAVGVLRRWRWTFWLVAIAFILGVLRVPASILQLYGLLSTDSPAWYTLLQTLIGLVQFAIGLAMLAGYRRSGAWGSF
jgi:predicted ferric reductase